MRFEGKCGITATVIQDSVCNDTRLTTFELEYPRFIHAEVMTHRMLSKNAASSRAIPVEKMIEHVKTNTAMPVFWGKNKPGMQAAEEVDNVREAKIAWQIARDDAIQAAVNLHDYRGLHKQISNRVTEPYQMMKIVISGTEWANLLWLRDHEAAQPEFAELAKQISKGFETSKPAYLNPGDLHVPYVTRVGTNYYTGDIKLSRQEALVVSASCCAQVSYRKSDDSLDKAKQIYDRLVNTSDGRMHASPFEHQAWGMYLNSNYFEYGVTHVDIKGQLWSGNFRNWTQHRQTLKGHAKW